METAAANPVQAANRATLHDAKLKEWLNSSSITLNVAVDSEGA